MFPWQLVAASFITLLATAPILEYVEKRRWVNAQTIVALVGFCASGYCIATGIYLLGDWHDPLSTVSPQEVGHAAGTHGGRGGIVILAIRFWPYLLIGFGGLLGFVCLVKIKQLFRQRSRA